MTTMTHGPVTHVELSGSLDHNDGLLPELAKTSLSVGAVVLTSPNWVGEALTKSTRAEFGTVWTFETRKMRDGEPRWWWNPIETVTDDKSAIRLAHWFAAGWERRGEGTDRFFDSSARDIFGWLLLAASLEERPVAAVADWLRAPTAAQPIATLRHHGYGDAAYQLRSVDEGPERVRYGIYGTAQLMTSCLDDPHVSAWVNPPRPDELREKFDAAAFVTTRDTLYVISPGKADPAWPLSSALIEAVTRHGDRADAQHQSRLSRGPWRGTRDRTNTADG